MDDELKDLCNQQCKLYAHLSTDRYGKDTYSDTPVEAACYIDESNKEIPRKGGTIDVATGTIYLAEIYPWLDEKANLYVPNTAHPTGWEWVEIMGVDELNDEVGPYVQIVYYGDKR